MDETLSSTINDRINPFDITRQIASGSTPSQRATTARKNVADLMEESSAAFEQGAMAGQKVKEEGIRAAATAERQFATQARAATEEFERTLPKRPEFEPTEFDPQAATDMAGFVGLLTAFMPGGSGRAALKSMKGVVDGAAAGQKDVYNQELKRFETDLATWKDNMVMAKDRLNRIIDLYSKDRAAALVESKFLETQLGGGVVAAEIRANRVGKALEFANKAIDLGDRIEMELSKATSRAKSQNLPADLAKSYNALAPNYSRFTRLNSEIQPNYFGIVPNETASRLLMKAVEVDLTEASTEYLKKKYNISEEQILWWKDYDQFVAKVRNELFGATLTKNEKENFDRTIISPATKPETAIKFFQEQVAIINRAVQREVQKGLARGVSPEVISAYLGVEVPNMPQVAQPDDTARIQQELQNRGLPYEPDRFNYGFENGRFFREPK